tara:strand:+ start:81 stop:503 length:423 start_codon:yes stop_codon:yes gene_type:complete
MKVLITEYLRINLDTEQWECRDCSKPIGTARKNYKEGLLVYHRDPREIHRPMLDPEKYAKGFSPDPKWCAILEFYCPHCGTMIEVEYTVPGHPPVNDLELDIDALRKQWSTRKEVTEHVAAGDPAPIVAHGHGHSHGLRA